MNGGLIVALILAVSLGMVIYYLITIVLKTDVAGEKIQERLKAIEVLGEAEKKESKEKKRTPSYMLRGLVKKAIRLIAGLLPLKSGDRRKVMRQIVRCGLTIKPEEYLAIYLLSISAGAAAGLYVNLILGGDLLQMLLLGVAGGPLLLWLELRQRAEKRKKELERELPEVLDLLRITVEAGLGFSQALQDVVEQGEGVLVGELAIVQNSLSMGATRKAAFKELANRCDVEEIRNFASSVIQSEELGIPLKNILDAQAQEARDAAWNRVEAQAQKIPIKMVLPMAVFIFPAVFIVILVPMLLQSMDVFLSL